MNGSVRPRYVLLAEVSQDPGRDGPSGKPRWRFVLQAMDGKKRLAVTDADPDFGGERLELLAVVRGLEALDQPSRVTLLTGSRYVRAGLRQGLAEWREHDWQWERFGQFVPVANRDLWQRVARALEFHQVDCRRWRFDSAQPPPPPRRCRPGRAPSSGRPSVRRAGAVGSRLFDERSRAWGTSLVDSPVWRWACGKLEQCCLKLARRLSPAAGV